MDNREIVLVLLAVAVALFFIRVMYLVMKGRRQQLAVAIDKNIPQDVDLEELEFAELPNGGARVVSPGKPAVAEAGASSGLVTTSPVERANARAEALGLGRGANAVPVLMDPVELSDETKLDETVGVSRRQEIVQGTDNQAGPVHVTKAKERNNPSGQERKELGIVIRPAADIDDGLASVQPDYEEKELLAERTIPVGIAAKGAASSNPTPTHKSVSAIAIRNVETDQSKENVINDDGSDVSGEEPSHQVRSITPPAMGFDPVAHAEDMADFSMTAGERIGGPPVNTRKAISQKDKANLSNSGEDETVVTSESALPSGALHGSAVEVSDTSEVRGSKSLNQSLTEKSIVTGVVEEVATLVRQESVQNQPEQLNKNTASQDTPLDIPEEPTEVRTASVRAQIAAPAETCQDGQAQVGPGDKTVGLNEQSSITKEVSQKETQEEFLQGESSREESIHKDVPQAKEPHEKLLEKELTQNALTREKISQEVTQEEEFGSNRTAELPKVADDTGATSSPIPDDKLSVVAPKPTDIRSASQRTEIRKQSLPVQPSEVVVINVMSREGRVFGGDQLLNSIINCGLSFGEMNIFHRRYGNENKGPVIFSLANILNPGTFDLNDMSEFSTVGVSLFLAMPTANNNLVAFEEMLNVAQKLCKALDGEIKDDQRNLISPQTIEHYRQRIQDFELRQLKASGSLG